MAGITENWKGRSREKEREGGGGREERGRMELGETAQNVMAVAYRYGRTTTWSWLTS